jgi:D-3-phosphoglycerate dehydrogenase
MSVSIPINTQAVAASPTTSTSLHDRMLSARHRSGSISDAIRQPKVLHPIENEGLRLLILENISLDAVARFREQGWHVDHYAKAMSEDELVGKIGTYHAIGIRSKTRITERVLKAATKVGISTVLFYGTRLMHAFLPVSCS